MKLSAQLLGYKIKKINTKKKNTHSIRSFKMQQVGTASLEVLVAGECNVLNDNVRRIINCGKTIEYSYISRTKSIGLAGSWI